MSLISKNPFSEKIITEVEELSFDQIEEKLETAEKVFHEWKKTSFAERKKLMLQLASVLRSEKESFATIITTEMGKPIQSAIAEVEKCALGCEYYAEFAESMMKPEMVATEAQESYVRFDPLGVILAVMPWNFPFWQVLRFAAPAIMSGNVGILKHASNVPQCGMAIEDAFHKAGFPRGVFQNLPIKSSAVEKIIQDPRVKAVTLTGSEYAGSQVAAQAGKALKKTVLELGGSDPFIVLADADVEQAANTAVNARLQNAGQSCIAAKRFILHTDIAEKFLVLYKEKFEAIVYGDPMDSSTELGPLATQSILEEIEEKVAQSVAMGAKILTGGKRWGSEGYGYLPTILTQVSKGMPAYGEEIFGPVASVIIVEDETEAIKIANDIPYGLGSSLWTTNTETADRIIPQIEAGSVFVNSMVKSDPRLPFGGVKLSGYGRELSHYGLREFVNVKSVWKQ